MSSSHLCHVFAHFCNNWRFWAIWFTTLAAQLFIVEYCGRYMRVVPLSWEQSAYCAAIGASSLIWGILLRLLVPVTWFDALRLEKQEDAEQDSMVSSWRNHRVVQSQSRRNT